MENEKKLDMYLSICPSGSKYFWCVTDGWANKIFAHGRTDTLEEAEDQIWAQAAIQKNGRQVIQCDAKLAKLVRKIIWQREQCRPLGLVVYSYYWPDSSNTRKSISHPIVKQTKRRIFVDYNDRLYSIDREQLENEGEVFSKKAGVIFHSVPYEQLHAAEIAEDQRQAEEERCRVRKELEAFPESLRQQLSEFWTSILPIPIDDETLLRLCYGSIPEF